MKSEGTIEGGEGAEGGSKSGECRDGSETGIVVGFGEVDEVTTGTGDF